MSGDEDFGSAEQPQTSTGRQYHVAVAPGEVAPMMILVGDPERANRVAERFSEVELSRSHREYVVHTGVHDGLRMSVIGTGMGAASTEIAVIELCQCVDDPTMIRCGSTGALQPGIELGDLAITQAALRMESASHSYVDERFPAVASPEAVMALVQAADERGVRHHVGLTATASGFYGAQGRDVPGFPPRDPGVVEELIRQRVLNLEMEAACLLTLAAFRGFRAGAVCAVYATRHAGAFIDAAKRHTAEANCIEVGLQALHHLHEMDEERGERANWHPGLRSG